MIVLRKPLKISFPSVAVAQKLIGVVDGYNKTFSTPHEYESSRISVMYNGQSLHSPEDFKEIDNNTIEFKYIVPLSDDVLRATYEYLGGTKPGGGTSTTLHSDLEGLTSDDHLQYLTNGRGDIRYYTKSQIDSMLGNKRIGQLNISNGAINTWVSIFPAFPDANYSISLSIENTSDSPSSIYSYNITAKTTNGFEVTYIGEIDSDNYVLSWMAIS